MNKRQRKKNAKNYKKELKELLWNSRKYHKTNANGVYEFIKENPVYE